MWVVAYMYVYALCACSALRGQKKASNPLGLELQVVVNHLIRSNLFIWKSGAISPVFHLIS